MKRGRKPFVAKNHIVGFNQLRMELGSRTITEDQFREELRHCSIPYNKNFWIALKYSGILEEKNKRFSFKDSHKPVHWSVLQDVYATYISKQRVYVQRQRDKKLAEKIAKEKEIQDAIKLLKKYNFKIYAPTRTLYAKI